MSELRTWLWIFGLNHSKVDARVKVGHMFVDIVGVRVMNDHQGRPADLALELDGEQLRAALASVQGVA